MYLWDLFFFFIRSNFLLSRNFSQRLSQLPSLNVYSNITLLKFLVNSCECVCVCWKSEREKAQWVCVCKILRVSFPVKWSKVESSVVRFPSERTLWHPSNLYIYTHVSCFYTFCNLQFYNSTIQHYILTRAFQSWISFEIKSKINSWATNSNSFKGVPNVNATLQFK